MGAKAAGGDLAEARRRASEILRESETLCGSNLVLDLARRQIAATDASVDATDIQGLECIRTRPGSITCWGATCIGWGSMTKSHREFARAIEIEPDAFWPNFYETLCYYQSGRFEDALNTAYVCVALSPKSPECFFNRGLCHQAPITTSRPSPIYYAALELAPHLAEAALRRGMLENETASLRRGGRGFRGSVGVGSRSRDDPLPIGAGLAVAAGQCGGPGARSPGAGPRRRIRARQTAGRGFTSPTVSNHGFRAAGINPAICASKVPRETLIPRDHPPFFGGILPLGLSTCVRFAPPFTS